MPCTTSSGPKDLRSPRNESVAIAGETGTRRRGLPRCDTLKGKPRALLPGSDDPVIATFGRPLRLGVAGGGPGAMIGPMHRRAAILDGRFEITAGVLSSDPARAVAAGIAIGLAPDRAYGSVEHMLEAEAGRADGVDAVAIMTPNDSHHRIAAAAIDRNLDVIIDKPLVNLTADATDLLHRVRHAGTILCVTHP